MVDVAIKAKNSGHEKDAIWVVFDREAKNKYPHELHAKACQKAKANGIEIAFSSVCFEVWLLLHFEYSTGSYHSCNDLLSRSRLVNHVKDLGFKDYEKSLALLFDKIKLLVPTAMSNADKLKRYAITSAERGKSAPYYLNPYVDIHEMFIDMKNYIKKKPSVRLTSS